MKKKKQERSISTIMLENGNRLVNPYFKKEWEEFVKTRDYKSTDVQYTYICLELLNRSNLTYNELSIYLNSLKGELKTIDVAYPIYKASQFSVFGKETLDECISLYGVIKSKEELEMIINKLETNKKRKRNR